MGQKQWKSLWKLKNFTFSIATRVLLFLKNYENYWFSQFIWIGPCKGFEAFSELQRNLWSVFWHLATCSKLLKFEYYRGRVTKMKKRPGIPRVPPWRPPSENELPTGDVWQKQFYKKKGVKTAAGLPSSAVVVVNRARSETCCHRVYTCNSWILMIFWRNH